MFREFGTNSGRPDTLSGVGDRPAAALKAFLGDPRRPKGTLRYHELQGFFFTVASAPDLVMPSEWMPVLFADQGAGYEDMAEAQRILPELMALYNSVNASVADGHAVLPRDCRFRGDVLANLEEAAPIAQWSRGFLLGHQWLEESWEDVPPELDDEFAAMLMTLSFFSSPRMADAFRVEAGRASLEEMATTMRRLFRTAVLEYGQLGRAIDQARRELARQPKRAEPKVGRNDSCPCGSGRKFKKCCGASVH